MLDDDPHTPRAGAIGNLNPVPTVTWGGAKDEERDQSEREREAATENKRETETELIEKNRETGRQR